MDPSPLVEVECGSTSTKEEIRAVYKEWGVPRVKGVRVFKPRILRVKGLRVFQGPPSKLTPPLPPGVVLSCPPKKKPPRNKPVTQTTFARRNIQTWYGD